MVLSKQEINRLLETLQKQQQQFTELADHVQLDAGIPVTFTKVYQHPAQDRILENTTIGEWDTSELLFPNNTYIVNICRHSFKASKICLLKHWQ